MTGEFPTFDSPRITHNPGPSMYMPGVRDYMSEAVEEIGQISHRDEEFQAVMKYTDGALRQLLEIPPDYTIAYLGSATEAMGLTIRNLAPNSSQHFVNGAFSEKYYREADAVRIIAHKQEIEMGEGFNLVETMEDIGDRELDLLCVTHNETSTGVQLDVMDIAELADRYMSQLIAVDITSSVPYVDLDFSRVDAAFFSVQKGFGMPAGMGVIVTSPEAVELSDALTRDGFDTGGHHSLKSLAEAAAKFQTPETPNMLAIYTLGRVAADMCAKGIEVIRAETNEKARLLYEYFDDCEDWKPFVGSEQFRSATVITADVGVGALALRAELEKRSGIRVGKGYGEFEDRHIRIANFPAYSHDDIEELIAALEEI